MRFFTETSDPPLRWGPNEHFAHLPSTQPGPWTPGRLVKGLEPLPGVGVWAGDSPPQLSLFMWNPVNCFN